MMHGSWEHDNYMLYGMTGPLTLRKSYCFHVDADALSQQGDHVAASNSRVC
jgi:hypothetical protein